MSSLSRSDVLIDLCTQRDYLMPGGARPIANASQVISNLRKLMAWARWAKAPILSVVDVRRRQEAMGVENAACVEGTAGQLKLAHTLMPSRTTIESDNCLCVPLDVLLHAQQAILAKRHRDPFTNPKLDRLLTEMPARRFIVFGVALDASIRQLVLGLMLRGRSVAVVGDACGQWNAQEADFHLRQIMAKGCEILTTRGYVQTHLSRVTLKTDRGRRSVA